MNNLRIGVINWDSALPPETFFGRYMARSLSPLKYHDRLPFFTEVKGENEVQFHYRTPEEFEKELSYAAEAGIDYFAHTWYSEEALGEADPESGNVDNVVWELDYARKLHQKSPRNKKVKLCAILICMHAYSDADFEKLALAMQEDYYEKIDGRPLLYLFGGYRVDVAARAEKAAKAIGLPKPFVAFMSNGAVPEGVDPREADAVTDYACTTGTPIHRFAELYDVMIEKNEARKKYGTQIIPQFTMGWDPSPRRDSPVPWTKYGDTPCAEGITEKEVTEGAEKLADWIKANPDYTGTGHILTFAWDEFEEGGFICPTLGKDGTPDTARLGMFEKAVEIWKNTLR